MLMSVPRDYPPRTGPGRPTGASGVRPGADVREDTEALPRPAEWDAAAGADPDLDEDDAEAPLSLPIGTRDRPPTRVESPAAARRPPSSARGPRSPHPPPPSIERPEDRIGTTLGAYRLHALIGKGGMGFVYRAEHARLGREVALKLLRSDYASRRDSVGRFFQEARTVNRIRHRNIVDVTDFVELEDGTTYIIMELLRGQSLGSWARHQFDVPRALGLLIQICDGLAAAHAVGVIHRDLKPDNVVVMPTGDGAETVKLLDFGVAKLLNRDDEDIGLETQAGSVIGTPAYMSPEQAGGMPIDARADIYSLGAMMYELFCGQPLFRGRSFGEYVRKHLNELPVPPRETARGATIDPRLEHILLRTLEKEPARRYQSVEELRDELLELLAGYETHDGPTPHARHRSGRVEPGPHLPLPAPPPSMTPAPRHITHDHAPPTAPTTGRRGVPGPFRPSAPPLDLALAALPEPAMHHAPTPYPGAHTSLAESLISLDPGLAPRSGRGIWFAAIAAVAAGIGVAGALVAAAQHREPESPPAVAPVVTPPAQPLVTAADPDPTTAPALIDVRIDAPAGARVLRAGGVEVCVAPCRISIDPADGASTVRREFLVHLDGFVDQAIAIELAAPPASIAVRFDQPLLPPGDDTATTAPAGDTATTAPTTAPGDDATAADRTDHGRKRPGGRTIPTTPGAEPPPTTHDPAIVPAPDVKPPIKKRGTVDPTDTIDPFATSPSPAP